jgi:hypothetical protein
MDLNVYVPGLQHVGGVVWYLRQHRGQRFASTATVAPMSEAFVARITEFIEQEGLGGWSWCTSARASARTTSRSSISRASGGARACSTGSGEWRTRVTAADTHEYDTRVASLVSPDLAS